MKIARTLIALSFTFVLGFAACKSSDTPPPDTAPATQPAEGAPPAEGVPPPEGDKPMEGEKAPEGGAPQR